MLPGREGSSVIVETPAASTDPKLHDPARAWPKSMLGGAAKRGHAEPDAKHQ